ncbi:MAG: RNA methyltransferase [Pseudomonadota bacterium]
MILSTRANVAYSARLEITFCERAKGTMRGYFGIGSERISKAMNLGAVMRTGHAFGASFLFTVGMRHRTKEAFQSDTSHAEQHVPLYNWACVDDIALPKSCALVGVELDSEATELPRFRHPLQAAYFLGPEKGNLSDAAKDRCDHLVVIPTKFCVNLSVAAAIIMYDRALALGGYPYRWSADEAKRPPAMRDLLGPVLD